MLTHLGTLLLVLQQNKKKDFTLVDAHGSLRALVDSLWLNFHDLRVTLNTGLRSDSNVDHWWLDGWQKSDLATVVTCEKDADDKHFAWLSLFDLFHWLMPNALWIHWMTHFWQPNKHHAMTGQETLIQFSFWLVWFSVFKNREKHPLFLKIPSNGAWSVVKEVFGLSTQTSGSQHFLRLRRDLVWTQTFKGLRLDRRTLPSVNDK